MTNGDVYMDETKLEAELSEMFEKNMQNHARRFPRLSENTSQRTRWAK